MTPLEKMITDGNVEGAKVSLRAHLETMKGSPSQVRLLREALEALEEGRPDAACEAIREVARLRRQNAMAKTKHQAMKDLGLKRVRGSLGGTYYE